MEALNLRSVASRRSFLGTLALGILFTLAGCETTGSFLNSDMTQSSDAPCRIEAMWNRGVATAADSQHNGAQLQGLAGRVYMFGTDGFTVIGEGELVVGLFDDTPRPGGTGPVELHEWKIDPVTLKRLLKKDVVGYGYTVFLPWPEDKPLLQHIQLKVRLNQQGRAPVFGDSGPIILEGVPSAGKTQEVTHSIKPLGQ
jgi:hypothetical protein